MFIKKKVGYFGIEIYNFDLHNKNNLNLLPHLLDKYLVIILKNTPLTNEEHITLATNFGEPTIAHPVIPGKKLFPNIYEINSVKGGKNAQWHTDVSYLSTPHYVSVITADEIPKIGGDTLWCDLRTSYEKINDELKKYLKTLNAVHKISPLAYWGVPFDHKLPENDIINLYENSKKILPVVHPVISIHHRTYKPSFFINPAYTSHILNLSKIESDNLLKLVYEHTTQPEYILRHKWEKNDVIIYDNLSTSHYAVDDYGKSIRNMRRITTKGNLIFGYYRNKSRISENLSEIIR